MATKVRMTRGKLNGIQAVANDRGIIAAAAMDQRGSLKKAIAKAKGTDASDAELTEFKVLGTRLLTPYASAILMDPEYGLPAVKAKAPNAGVLSPTEDRLRRLKRAGCRTSWTAGPCRLIAAGAERVKILLYNR
jgi:tagatose 1,6-diphosphate aldolase